MIAPDGASGGGMGRVKDNIVRTEDGRFGTVRAVELVTRDGRGRGQSMLLLVRAAWRILRGRLDGRVALVHVNMGDRGSVFRKGVLVLFARLLGLPVFLHLHAVTLERDVLALPGFLRPVVFWPFRAATCVIVLGTRWQRWLRAQPGLDRVPIEVLTNGVPVEPRPRSHAPSPGPREILFLGNLLERKGVSDLIAALAMVPTGDQGWIARFAGSGDIAGYTAAAQAAGIADRVEFVGWVGQETAQAMVRAADILVLPSYDEGLPLAVIEALGLGTPVVTTPVGALPEVLTDGHDVLFSPAGDRERLARAIARVLDDATLRQGLCDHGQETFRRCFSMEAFGRNLREIWRRHLPAGAIGPAG